jgi:hypothetical protein
MICTILFITWPIVGLITGLILSKIDKTTINLKELVAYIILGYTLIFTIIWGEAVDKVIKKNPVLLDFRKKN